MQDSLPNVQQLRDRWSPRSAGTGATPPEREETPAAAGTGPTGATGARTGPTGTRSGATGTRSGATGTRAGTATAPAHHLTRRIAAAVAALGVVLLAALLILTSGSTSDRPPATAAAALVPSDALLYIHLSTDTSRPGVQRADQLFARLPGHGAGLTSLAQRIVAVVGGSAATSYSRDIRPWLGKEAAFALLNTAGSSAGSVIVLAVANRAKAAAFIANRGAHPAGSYDGIRLYRYPTGAELAFARGFLLAGTDVSLRAGLDAAAHRRPALEADPTYQRAAATELPGRVLDVYLSASGVTRVLESRTDLLGLLGSLLARPGLLGSAISVQAASPGLRLRIHSVLNAKAAGSRLQPFTPSLASVLPSGSTAMLDARSLSTIGPMALNAGGRIGLLSGVPELLHRIGAVLTADGYDVHGLLSLFSGETAIALAAGEGAPAFVIVTRTSHEQQARTMLASLEAPLSQMFTAPAENVGFTPQFNDVQVGGVAAHQMLLAPGLQLDYSVFRGLIVVATSLRGIADVAARSHSLASQADYRQVLAEQPTSVTSLGSADFSQLLSLGEQTQLARSASFRALLPDLAKIRAVGMYSTSGEADTTMDALFQLPS